MANHHITIHLAGPYRRPDKEHLTVHSGDTFTFTADADAPSIICLSPEVAAVLTPQEGVTAIDLPAGATVSFKLGEVAPGAYAIGIQTLGWACPMNLGTEQVKHGRAVFSIRGCRGNDFPGPDEVVVGKDGN